MEALHFDLEQLEQLHLRCFKSNILACNSSSRTSLGDIYLSGLYAVTA